MTVKRSGLQFLEARRQCNCRFPQIYAPSNNSPKLVDQVAITEYEAIKAEYDLERTCFGQMMKLESTLHESRLLVQEVTAKLGIFASVWAIVRLRNCCTGELVAYLLAIHVLDHGGHTKTEEFPSPCGRSYITGENMGLLSVEHSC